MKATLFKNKVPLAIILGICGIAAWTVLHAKAADTASATAPQVIQDGFKLWEKSGPSGAFYEWQKDGLLEGGMKYTSLTTYFRRLDRSLGSYKSFDVVETKHIGDRSQIVYLAMNFERVAVYARFVLYRAEKKWVVQNMDFSPKPEALMPWLAFQDVNYSD